MLTVPGHRFHKSELIVNVLQTLIQEIRIRHEKVLEEIFHFVVDGKRDLDNNIIPNVHELLEQIGELIQEELPDLCSPVKKFLPVIDSEVDQFLDLIKEGLPEVCSPIQKILELADHGILQTGNLLKEISPEPGHQVIGFFQGCYEIITQRNNFI